MQKKPKKKKLDFYDIIHEMKFWQFSLGGQILLSFLIALPLVLSPGLGGFLYFYCPFLPVVTLLSLSTLFSAIYEKSFIGVVIALGPVYVILKMVGWF